MTFLRLTLATVVLIGSAITYGIATASCDAAQAEIERQERHQQQLDEEALRLAEECERAFPRNKTQQQACVEGVL